MEASSQCFLQAHSDPVDSSSNRKHVKCETWKKHEKARVLLDLLVSFALLQNDKADQRNHKNKTKCQSWSNRARFNVIAHPFCQR